jgi:hypothetical protein
VGAELEDLREFLPPPVEEFLRHHGDHHA